MVDATTDLRIEIAAAVAETPKPVSQSSPQIGVPTASVASRACAKVPIARSAVSFQNCLLIIRLDLLAALNLGNILLKLTNSGQNFRELVRVDIFKLRVILQRVANQSFIKHMAFRDLACFQTTKVIAGIKTVRQLVVNIINLIRQVFLTSLR